MNRLIQTMRDLVLGNRILAQEGVVDAFGHLSVRHPDNPERYLMSCSRAPALVTFEDIVELTLDGAPVEDSARSLYLERCIHGAILEQRPDVHAVVHNHSHAVIPFSVTGAKLRAMVHLGAAIGAEVPVWDIRDKFGATDLLVVNMEQGRDLARRLAGNRVVLMRGHGCTVAGNSIRHAVMISVYLQIAARLQREAMQLGEVEYLTPEEIELCSEMFVGEVTVGKTWEYLAARAGGSSL